MCSYYGKYYGWQYFTCFIFLSMMFWPKKGHICALNAMKNYTLELLHLDMSFCFLSNKIFHLSLLSPDHVINIGLVQLSWNWQMFSFAELQKYARLKYLVHLWISRIWWTCEYGRERMGGKKSLNFLSPGDKTSWLVERRRAQGWKGWKIPENYKKQEINDM